MHGFSGRSARHRRRHGTDALFHDASRYGGRPSGARRSRGDRHVHGHHPLYIALLRSGARLPRCGSLERRRRGGARDPLRRRDRRPDFGGPLHLLGGAHLRRFRLLFGHEDVPGRQTRTDPPSAGRSGDVRGGVRHRRHLVACRRGRGLHLRSLHDVLQRQDAQRHRHLGGSGLSHCLCGYDRLHLERLGH